MVIPVDIAERRQEKALDAATTEFQQEITRLTMKVVLLACPGIEMGDALKECARLLRLVADECERAEILPPGGAGRTP